MALGPFLSYAPPGVYTKTLSDTNASNLVAGLRIPALIGVGQEELEQDELELVRGSSATVDQQVVNEDVTASWIVDGRNVNAPIFGTQDGTLSSVRVRNYPIVDGQGFGRVTNDTRSLSVTVNGSPVAIGSVQGQRGIVTLQVPTQPNDVVRVTYFFHRGDTSFTDDLSDQVTAGSASLTTPGFGPFDTSNGANQLVLSASGTVATISLPIGSAVSASTLVAGINAAQIPNLMASVVTDNQGNEHIQFTTSMDLQIQSGSANGALGLMVGASTGRNRAFRVMQRPIVDGSSGGITTTDTSKVVVKVNGSQVVPASIDGTNGVVTLPYAPAAGATVSIQYFSNTWQDTFDYLPNSLVTNVLRCGIAPGRSDYIQGTDFVVSNPTTDVSVINWGASYQVSATSSTAGATPFDGSTGSGGQVVGQLIDDQIFLGACTRVVNTSTIPATVSLTDYLLPEVPTSGNGRSTTLGSSTFNAVTNSRQDLVTNRPDLIKVYTGRNLRDALNRPAVPVASVDGLNRRIVLKTAQPPDYQAYATFFYSRLNDDAYVLTNKVPGPIGVGQYSIFSSTSQSNLYGVKFGSKSGLSQIVQWPRGSELVPDAFHTGSGTPVSETVTVTFGQDNPTNAAWTIDGAAPYAFFNSSSTWITKVNGTPVTTTLNAAAPGIMVGSRISLNSTGNVVVPAAPSNVFNFTLDGVDKTASLTSGTPQSIADAINTAAGSTCASFAQVGDSSGDVFFILKSQVVPGSMFDTSSSVKIKQGTAETALGFKTFASVSGSSGAICKPATLVGSSTGPFTITAGQNDVFLVQVDGSTQTVTLTAGTKTADDIATDINTKTGLNIAFAATGSNANKLRLISPTNTSGSSLQVGTGTANDTLGFSAQAYASQTLVSAQELVNALMNTTNFASGAVAYVDSMNGSDYVTLESLATGQAGSSIGFASCSAFSLNSGAGVTPSTDGDVGEDPQSVFTVSSSSPSGSAGTGIPGQTYTDAQTGLRFTVLPSATGTYDDGGSFTLVVSDTFNVSPSVPTYAVGGLELLVTNTVGVGVNDTSTLTTFNPDGVEPAVGDFYTISYRYLKQDYTPQVYQQMKVIEANFGSVSAENRITMAASLAILNGAVLVIIKQVLKVPGTNQASDQSYNAAIDELATPLPGNIKPDIIVPLATSAGVYTHLTAHCETQSNIRNQAERIGFIGFASGTSPTTAQAVARGLNSSRTVAFYPDSAVVTVTDELGQNAEHLVDGSFFAAAVAGSAVATSVDVATPYTRRRVQGFTRIPRRMDPVEANQTAVAGITILEDLDPIIRIRQGLTTNMASVLTRLPTVIQISDFVQQQSRATLDSFIGTKFLDSRTNEVLVSMTALFRSLVQAEIVGGFTGMTAQVDPNDPTTLRFEMLYAPIFPLLYIVLTFSLRARV